MPAAVPEDLIDLARYPITAPELPAYRRIVAEGRAALDDRAVYTLPGFLTADAVAALVDEGDRQVRDAGHREVGYGTPYKEIHSQDLGPGEVGLTADTVDSVNSLPADHPRRRTYRRATHGAHYEDFRPDAVIARLYESDALTDFVGDVLGHRIYRCADRRLSLAIVDIVKGGELGWHFDYNDFVVTILLRPAARGGCFEVAPLIRDDDDENYEGVARVLDGDHPAVRAVPMAPGTMCLFKGRRSLHRVSPVESDQSRLNAVLSYDRRPDVMFPQ